MEARLYPLEGKYYGSRISFADGGSISIWYHKSFVPSNRQLDAWGMTMEEAMGGDMICDSHFESVESYKIAEAIVGALKNIEI